MSVNEKQSMKSKNKQCRLGDQVGVQEHHGRWLSRHQEESPPSARVSTGGHALLPAVVEVHG